MTSLFGVHVASPEEMERDSIANREGINPTHLRGPFLVRFEMLRSGAYAYIDEHRRIFFPQNFSPISGQEYRTYYVQTRTGIFTHEGAAHRVCRVYLADEGARTIESYRRKKPHQSESLENSPFAVALQGFRAIEKYDAFARMDNKDGVTKLAPVYKDIDPDFDDRPTMYFLHSSMKDSLENGKRYRVRVESKKSIGRVNCRGALMIDVQVSIID